MIAPTTDLATTGLTATDLTDLDTEGLTTAAATRPLEGTWSLVLGASSGMGRAVADAIAAAGGNVAGVHFDTGARADEIAEFVGSLRDRGVEVAFTNANAASADTRAQVVADLTERLADQPGAPASGGLRIVLHSLAFGSLVPFLGGERPLTRRQLDMTLDVMAHSLVYWTQDLVAAGLLGPGAKVLAMTSAGATRVSATYGAVSAAKCALESHVRQLALELAPRGVAVNALRAGVTVTPSLERIPEHQELIAKATAANPHGRLTRPEDVAEAVLMLAATPSSWLTGNVIGVDGGEGLCT